MIATGNDLDPKALVDRANQIPKMEGSDLVRGVSSAKIFDWPTEDPDEFGVCAYTGDGSFKHGSPPVPTRGAAMRYVHAP